MKKLLSLLILGIFAVSTTKAQHVEQPFNGLGMGLGNLPTLSTAKTRSISAENFTGEKGRGGMAQISDSLHRNVANGGRNARELGQGWKVNPYIVIKPGETFTLANITGPGAIQHIWMTPQANWRLQILRIYWDDENTPSVECPIGDFFGQGFGTYAQIISLPMAVNPYNGFNSYWLMPFRKKCKITVENMDTRGDGLYFQIDYTLTPIPKNMGYFHAQFRRANPDSTSNYVILDRVKGHGQYVGTYMAWTPTNPGWWGEGEVKFFIDGDKQFPTINGTGTEDYFLGSYGFTVNNKPVVYTTPFVGVNQILQPDSLHKYQRFSMYRWHVMDPVRFEKDLKITMQDLGWKPRNGPKAPFIFLQQKSDISSVAYWYQTEPHNPFPALPTKEQLSAK